MKGKGKEDRREERERRREKGKDGEGGEKGRGSRREGERGEGGDNSILNLREDGGEGVGKMSTLLNHDIIHTKNRIFKTEHECAGRYGPHASVLCAKWSTVLRVQTDTVRKRCTLQEGSRRTDLNKEWQLDAWRRSI